MKMKILVFIAILMNLSCNKVYKVNNIGGLPFDKEANNVAALFTMTDENGRKQNLSMMESIFFDGSLGFNCQSYHNKPSKFIYEKIADLAKEVKKDGTLLLYLNSHGGGSGSRFGMTASDGWFKFSKVVQSIAESNKVKRLIVLIDTCHAAGGIQEGFEGKEKIIPNIKTGLPELPDLYKEDKKIKTSTNSLFKTNEQDDFLLVDYGENSGAYDEVLIIASSSVEDLSVRGAFAARLKKAFENAKSNNDISIKDFLVNFAKLHSNTNQKPHYKIIPNDNMLYEPLFYNLPIRDIPIIDKDNPDMKFDKDYIPLPQNEK